MPVLSAPLIIELTTGRYLQEPDDGLGTGQTVLPLADAHESVMRSTKLHWTEPNPHALGMRAKHRSNVRYSAVLANVCMYTSDEKMGGKRRERRKGVDEGARSSKLPCLLVHVALCVMAVRYAVPRDMHTTA